MKRYYLAAAILVIVSLAAALGSVKLSGPGVNDTRASSDLQEINNSVVAYHDQYDKLPDSLRQVKVSPEISKRLSQYEYVPEAVIPTPTKAPRPNVGSAYAESIESSYKLCATFKTDTTKGQFKSEGNYFNPSDHRKGRQCFTGTVTAPFETPASR